MHVELPVPGLANPSGRRQDLLDGGVLGQQRAEYIELIGVAHQAGKLEQPRRQGCRQVLLVVPDDGGADELLFGWRQVCQQRVFAYDGQRGGGMVAGEAVVERVVLFELRKTADIVQQGDDAG